MNPGRARRVFWLGLLISVLLHLGLLSRDWVMPDRLNLGDASAPIEARLMPTRASIKAIAEPKPPPKLVPPQAAPQKRPPAAPPVAEVPPDIADVAPVSEVPPQDAAPAMEPEPTAPAEFITPAESTAPAESTTPAEPDETAAPVESAPPLNPLPRRITLEYRARYGLASGKQTLIWVNEGDRYTITSVVSARGFASLMFSGQMVQTSHGRITAQGLRPEEFWDQRGSKRSQSRFDYGAGTIHTESNKGPRTAPLPAGVQDAQSLLFQIALTAPPATESARAVFNGKKVRNYRYRVTGEETLDTALGALRTLHLVRQTDSDAERFEIWLALDHAYLPVKLATEVSGYDAELLVESLASEP